MLKQASNLNGQKLFALCLSIAIPALILSIATPAQATCTYEGTTYQTGDTVGPYVCMPDGSWQAR